LKSSEYSELFFGVLFFAELFFLLFFDEEEELELLEDFFDLCFYGSDSLLE